MLFFPCVRGTATGGELPPDAAAQADRMFRNAAEGLDRFGFSYRQVARTWIYARRLLDWYGELNRVRTARYAELGFPSDGSVPFPASTGIQAAAGEDECVMSVLAVDGGSGEKLAVRPLASARQGEAFKYGSAFSRATSLEQGGAATILVSGTASIAATGESLYPGDYERQALETLFCLGSVLAKYGASLADIRQATVFCKDEAAATAYLNVCRLLALPPLPEILVRADVCRPDLLIEIEAVASVPAVTGRREVEREAWRPERLALHEADAPMSAGNWGHHKADVMVSPISAPPFSTPVRFSPKAPTVPISGDV